MAAGRTEFNYITEIENLIHELASIKSVKDLNIAIKLDKDVEFDTDTFHNLQLLKRSVLSELKNLKEQVENQNENLPYSFTSFVGKVSERYWANYHTHHKHHHESVKKARKRESLFSKDSGMTVPIELKIAIVNKKVGRNISPGGTKRVGEIAILIDDGSNKMIEKIQTGRAAGGPAGGESIFTKDSLTLDLQPTKEGFVSLAVQYGKGKNRRTLAQVSIAIELVNAVIKEDPTHGKLIEKIKQGLRKSAREEQLTEIRAEGYNYLSKDHPLATITRR